MGLGKVQRMDRTQSDLRYFILVMPPEKIAIFIWSIFFSLLDFLAFIPLSIQERGFILLFKLAGI
jgi:hypothetical protein